MPKLISRRKDLKWGSEAKKGSGNPNFSGGKYIDDKGYVRVLRPEHQYENHGYVYEHRLVLENELGRLLRPEESVHHINEVKLDNRLENLFLTTVAEHTAIHRAGKKVTMENKNKLREGIRQKRKDKGFRRRLPDGRYAPIEDKSAPGYSE